MHWPTVCVCAGYTVFSAVFLYFGFAFVAWELLWPIVWGMHERFLYLGFWCISLLAIPLISMEMRHCRQRRNRLSDW